MTNEQHIIENLTEVIRDALEYNYGLGKVGLYHWRYQALKTLHDWNPKAFNDLDPEAKMPGWNGKKRAKEKILPCPFCSVSSCLSVEMNDKGDWFLRCKDCGYRSMARRTAVSAIEVHNIMSSKAKGVVNA